MEKLLTIKDLCELLQLSKSLLYKWVHYAFIPHVKLGSNVRFRQSEVEKWLKKRSKKGRLDCQISIDL